MTTAFVDTTVLIHLFRKDKAAIAWFRPQPPLSITPYTWMEIMDGVASPRAQTDTLMLLEVFELIYPTPEDMQWAMMQLREHRLSKGVHMMDCFNAAVCHRLNVPIYTHNVKDYVKILPPALVIRPY